MISIYGYDLPAWFSPPETSIASIIYAKLLTLGLLPPLKRDSNPRSGNNQINYQFNDHWSRLRAATFRKCGKFSPPKPSLQEWHRKQIEMGYRNWCGFYDEGRFTTRGFLACFVRETGRVYDNQTLKLNHRNAEKILWKFYSNFESLERVGLLKCKINAIWNNKYYDICQSNDWSLFSSENYVLWLIWHTFFHYTALISS